MKLIVPFALIGIIGLALCGIGAIQWRSGQHFVDTAVEVPGTVVDMRASTDSDGDDMYAPVYEYVVDGTRHRHTSSVSSSSHPTMGETVTMLVDPDQPSKAKTDTFMELWFVPTLMAGLGASFLVVPLVALIVVLVRVLRSSSSSTLQTHYATEPTTSDERQGPFL